MKLDRTSMLYGTLVLTLTSIVSQFLGFVYRIFLPRLIGAEVMGLYQLIMPVFSVLLSLTAVGLTAGGVQPVLPVPRHGPPRRDRAGAPPLSGVLPPAVRRRGGGGGGALRTPSRCTCWGTPAPSWGCCSCCPASCSPGWRTSQALLLRHGQHPSPGGGGTVRAVYPHRGVLGLLVLFLPPEPGAHRGLIVLGMITCEVFSAVTPLFSDPAAAEPGGLPGGGAAPEPPHALHRGAHRP